MGGLSRSLVYLGTTYLLLCHVACEEEEAAGDGEVGTCSAATPDACDDEQKETMKVTSQLIEEGNALAGKEDYAGALKLYKLALQVDNQSSWSANAFVNAGTALKSMGKINEGVEMLIAGVKLNPEAFHGQYNLANTLFELKRWGEADTAFSAAVSYATPDTQHHALIGHVRMMLRAYHYEEGRSAFAGRDMLGDLSKLALKLSVFVKTMETPAPDLVSLVSNVLVLAGKRKEGNAWHEWAVKQGIWNHPLQRPAALNADFARAYKSTPWIKGGKNDLPDFLEELSDNWKTLQKEFDSLMKKEKLQPPADTGDSDFQWYDKSKGHDWRQLEIFDMGQKNFANAKIAKKAASLFGDTQVKGDQHARVFYSAMTPGTKTITRCGLSNMRYTCYMGLRVPNVEIEKLGITVAGETRGIKEGAWSCFDDSFEHTIYNEADELSGTVVVQFQNPAVPKTLQRPR